MAYTDPNFEARRQAILGNTLQSQPKVNTPTSSNGASFDPNFEARRVQVYNTPVKKVAPVKISQPTPQPQQNKFISDVVTNVSKAGEDLVSNVKGFFTPKGSTKPVPITLPKDIFSQPFSQETQNKIAKLKVGEKISVSGSSAQLKNPSLEKPYSGNLIDDIFIKPGAYLLDNTGEFGETIKREVSNVYEHPATFMLQRQLGITSITPDPIRKEIMKHSPKIVNKAIDDLTKNNPVMKFYNEVGKGEIQGALRVYANFSPTVSKFLDKELEKPVKQEDIVANTVGNTIGTIAAFVLGGEVLTALKFGKVALPATFAALGQTSLPADTPADARLRNLVIDTVTGTFLEYLKPLANLGKLDFVKQTAKSMSALSAQVYLDARSVGANNEQALEMVKSNAFILLGLHGFMVAGKATKYATQSKFKEGVAEFTPQQARDIVVGSNLEKSPLGKEILKQSFNADAQGKNLKIDMVAAKESKIAGVLKKFTGLKTPNGIGIRSIDLVDPTKPEIAQPGQPEQPKAEQAAPVAPKDFTNVEIVHGTNTPMDVVKSQGLHVSRNPIEFLGKAVYFSDSSTMTGEHGASQVGINTKDLNLKTFNSLEEVQNYIKDQEATNLSDAVIKDPALDGFIYTNPDPAIGNTFGITNVNKVNQIVKGEEPEKAEGQVFDYQSTQIDLPKQDAAKVVELGNKIPEELLYKDPAANYPAEKTGRENEPHVTVLYGLDNKLTVNDVKKALGDNLEPVEITLGKTSLFDTNEKYDVLKIDIESPTLVALNKKLSSLPTPGQTFKDYKPHVTIAYLKKGEGQKYIEDTSLEGTKIKLNELSFSKNNGEMIHIPLKGESVPQSENLVMQPTKADTPEKISSEVTKLDLSPSVLKFAFARSGKQFAYARPLIGKTDFKTILKNSNEFSANPVMRVVKNKKGDIRLAYKGEKMHFEINPDAMQLKSENLKVGDKVFVDETSLTGKEQQMRIYKNGQVFASMDAFADLKSKTKEVENLKAIEFPELVKMAKELMDDFPSVALPRFRPTLGGRPNGLFVAGGNGKIVLNPAVFKDPQQAAKTLAHELGHLIDWLPDKTMARGNILGRIASLRRYMKTMLKEHPESERDLLTPKERAKIRREAQKAGMTNYETITHEIEVGREPTTPAEILSIWNDATSNIKNPELLSYIQGLSGAQKKELVISAMRGNVPAWVKFVHSVKKTITEKVLKNSPADIRALYKKMLKEEILRRRLVDLETIKKELTMLSQKWKPYNPNMEERGYIKYRQSPEELYADAVSVLFNDPEMLKQEAPTFYKAFFNYLDLKPEAKEAMFEVFNLLNKGEEAVFQSRQADVEKMFDKAEEAYTAKELEKQKIKTNFVYTLKLLFNNKNEPLIRKVNQARKAGKLIDSSTNPVFAYEGLNYMDGKLENFIENTFQPVYEKAQGLSEDGWTKLGSILLYERSINERGEMANPLGFNPKTAEDQIKGLEKSMDPKDWIALQDTLKQFRSATEKIVKMAEDNEFYNPELLKQIKANKSYATFQVIDYLDTYISAHVYHAVGTLKEIANPATSSVIKGISVMKAIERNNAKKSAIAFFQENFPKEITPAKTFFDGKRKRFLEPKEKDLGMVTLIEKGKMTAYYVDKDVADTLNGLSNDTINKAAKISRIITGSPVYRPLFTTMNIGFQTFNFVRDFHRYWVNTPDYTLTQALTSFPRAIGRYAQAVPSAYKKALHIPDKTISEMKEKGIMGATYNDMFHPNDVNAEDQQIERILQRVGLLDKPSKHKIFSLIFKVLDAVEATGNFIEALPKIAGYNELKGKMSKEELADFIRTKIGSPNFRVTGQLTPVTNNVFLFSNAIKEGMKSDYQVASGKVGKGAAGSFWWKTIVSTFLPILIAFAGSMGLFGKWYEDRMKDVSEYDKTNYTIIPLGVDKNGQTLFMLVPRAETQRFLGGLLWKTLSMSNRKDLQLEDIFDVFDYGAGQLPSVTPAITGTGALISYLSGHNPYDSFRNRYVIPDTEFKAGYSKSLPIFMDWFIKNQGAGIIFPSYVDKDPTPLQKMLALPFVSNIAGRWLKVTNYGQVEENRRIQDKVEREAAQKTLKSRDAVDSALKEYKSGEQTREREIVILKKLIKDIVPKIESSADKTRRTNLIKKFKMGIIKGKSDPLVNSIIDANTNDEKVAIILASKEKLGTGYKPFVNNLLKQKVITGNVIQKLKNK